MRLGVYFLLFWRISTAHARFRIERTTNASVSTPTVDLGYGIYEGYYNATSQLNIFKGYVNTCSISVPVLSGAACNFGQNNLLIIQLRIRYAAPPLETLRWQKPQPPALNRSQTFSAKTYPPRCPQSTESTG